MGRRSNKDKKLEDLKVKAWSYVDALEYVLLKYQMFEANERLIDIREMLIAEIDKTEKM